MAENAEEARRLAAESNRGEELENASDEVKRMVRQMSGIEVRSH